MKPKKILQRISPFRKRTHNRWNRNSFEKFEDDYDPFLTDEADLEKSFEAESPSKDIFEFVAGDGTEAEQHVVENAPAQFLIHSHDCDSSETSEASPVPADAQDMEVSSSLGTHDIDTQVKEFFPVWKEEEPMIETDDDAIQELVLSRVDRHLFALVEEDDIEQPENDASETPDSSPVATKEITETEEAIEDIPVDEHFVAFKDESAVPFDCLDSEGKEVSPVPIEESPKDVKIEEALDAALETVEPREEETVELAIPCKDEEDVVENQESSPLTADEPPEENDAREESEEPLDAALEKVAPREDEPTNLAVTSEEKDGPSSNPDAVSGCSALEVTDATPITPKSNALSDKAHPFYVRPIKLSVLLLDPRSKSFELIQMLHCPSSSSLQGALRIIQQQASEPALLSQTYTGLYHAKHETEITEETLMHVKERHVLVAIPQGYTTEEIAVFAKEVLSTKSMSKFVHDLGHAKKIKSHHHSHKKQSKKSPLATVPEREEKVKLLVLLMDPRFRMFELSEIKYRPSTGTINRILRKIPKKATRPELGYHKYVGLCRPSDGVELTKECLAAGDCKVVVAVPEGYTADKVASYARQILSSGSITKALGDKVDKEILIASTKEAEPSSAPETPPSPTVRKNESKRSLSEDLETESLPSMMSSVSSSSSVTSSPSSCMTPPHGAMVSPLCSEGGETPVHRLLVKKWSSVYTGTALSPSRKSGRRGRRSQRSSFMRRAAMVAMVLMISIYKCSNQRALVEAPSTSFGFSELAQAVVMLFCMIVAQGIIQEDQNKLKHKPKPQTSGIPETVLVDLDDRGIPSYYPFRNLTCDA